MFGKKKEKNDKETMENDFSEIPAEPTVTVIIPAFNEEEHIAETIQNITEQTYPKIEILVVDDSSTDKTGEIARECGVRVEKTPENTGTKAQAQNYVLPMVKTDLTITIDGDTTLEANAIEIIVGEFVKDPKIASACGFIIPEHRKNFWELGRMVQYMYGMFMRKETQEYLGVPMVCSGCFSTFNTKLLQKYGFDSGTMAEDMYLTWKWLSEKRTIRYCENAVCYPKEPYNWKTYRGQVERWLRSFFQNISVHRKDLWKNKKLGFFISFYLIEGMLGMVFYGLLVWLMIFPPTQNLVFSAQGHYLVFPLKFLMPLMYLSSVAIVTVASLYQASKFKIRKREVLKGIPCYFALTLIDCVLFLNAFIQEWILKRRLTGWEKGH